MDTNLGGAKLTSQFPIARGTDDSGSSDPVEARLYLEIDDDSDQIALFHDYPLVVATANKKRRKNFLYTLPNKYLSSLRVQKEF